MQRDKKGRFVSTMASAHVFDIPKRPGFMSTMPIPYVARMQYQLYPQCCGAGIWSGFSNMPQTKNVEHFERAFKIEFDAMRSSMVSHRHGMVSAIITKTQLTERPALHNAMVKAGFQVIHTTGNPNHNYETTLFHYSYVAPHRTAQVVTNEEVMDTLSTIAAKTPKIF